MPIRALNFKSEACEPCAEMERRKWLEKLKQKHGAHVEIETHIIQDADGAPLQPAYELSDEYLIKELPTIVFVDGTAERELCRIAGPSKFSEIETAYTDAKTRLEMMEKRKRP